MPENEVIQQVIDSVKRDILANRAFKDSIKTMLSDLIKENLIYDIMSKFSAKQAPPKPKSNSPKEIVIGDNTVVAKPIILGEGSKEAQIVSDLLAGNNCYLLGKAGTGKTYTAKAIAESVMGQTAFVINCSQWTSPIEIRGGQTIRGYEDGQLIRAWEEGGVLILDELPKLDPNTAGLLNDALAEAATQPKYDEKGKVIEKTIPYIVNGRGEKVYKGQKQTNPDLKFRFCCIATGNTDMMNVGNKYGGNQRQDYSLVDRFAGSFYYIESDTYTEMKLTYAYVYKVCNAIRNFLDSKADAPQSISLRTMLNFNRTYEQEMLYKLGEPGKPNPFADEIKDNNGNVVPPKSVDDAISSFLKMMEKNLREELELDADFREARRPENKNETNFIQEFRKKYKFDPVTGKEIDPSEPPKAKK